MSDFPTIGHVPLTVKDLGASRPWCQKLIGSAPVLDEPFDGGLHHAVFRVDSTLVGLHEHASAAADDGFTEFRVGLDHVGLGCESREDLESWQSA